MTTVLIVIHLMVVLALIGLVLLQRSEGGALGIGGGSGGFMTGRGAGNVLTRSTAVLAAAFFVTSIGLTLLSRLESRPGDILDRIPGTAAPASAPAAANPAPANPAPASPAGPPGSAADLLKSLGGGAAGPQTPPAGTPQGNATPPDSNTAPQEPPLQSAPAPQPSAGGAQPAPSASSQAPAPAAPKP